jgi:hypothetical protein
VRAALADEAADPKLGALIALSLVYQSPETIRHVTIAGVAPDGSLATTAWAGPRAIPPELHKPLAAQRHQLISLGAPPDSPLLPTRTKRPRPPTRSSECSKRSTRPAASGTSTPMTTPRIPETDGRVILHALNALDLFRHR